MKSKREKKVKDIVGLVLGLCIMMTTILFVAWHFDPLLATTEGWRNVLLSSIIGLGAIGFGVIIMVRFYEVWAENIK